MNGWSDCCGLLIIKSRLETNHGCLEKIKRNRKKLTSLRPVAVAHIN